MAPHFWQRQTPPAKASSTARTPLDAARQIERVLAEFHFSLKSSGLFSGGLAGDYFFAGIGVKSAMGEEMEALCQWKRDGETEVRFQSDLPEAEHAVVLKR